MATFGGAEAEEKKKTTTNKRLVSTEELRHHTDPSDLWISIQGKVFDVTHWTTHHPGGDLPLLHLAGQDATDAFIAYHPGTAWHHLDRFSIGHLSDYRVSDVSRDYRNLVIEFTKLGLFDDKGHNVGVLFCLIAAMLSAVVYSVVYVNNPLVHVLSGGLLGFLWIQSGWIGHDSGHYSVMPTKGLNRLVQILTGNCLAGICIAWWKRNHNVHHIACNSLDYDPDVQYMPLFAIHSRFFHSIKSYFYNRKLEFNSLAKVLVSYQHWTFYPIMGIARINLFAQSILLLCSNKRIPNRGQEVLGIVSFWVWYPLLVSFLPCWWERVAFVLSSFAVVGIQHVQFCLNHFSSEVYEGPPRGGEWFERQTVGTLNIDCPPWMDWFHGGLHLQVEHHLFPRLPRCHFRRIAPRVRELCKKHGLPYSSASFWESNVMIVRTLRKAAMQARELGTGVAKNLVWEAVNTHG